MAYDAESTADAVRAGMEVLVWQVAEEHWNQIGVLGGGITEMRKQRARSLAGLAAVATVPILVPFFFFTWPGDEAAALGFLINVAAMPVAGAIAYALTLGAIRRTLGPDVPEVPMPPRVVLTTNGIILGGRAWQWRAPHYRLAGAELHGDDPVRLRLTFRGTGLRRLLVAETLEIPFPSGLDRDLAELRELLDIKTRLTG